MSRDSAAIEKRQQRLADTIAKALQGMAGVTCAVVKSLYSPSVRLHVDIDAEQAGVSAWEINEDMGRLDPVIKTDDYFVSGGKLIFDMAYLDSEDAALIADVLRSYLTGERRAAQRENVPKPRQDILYEMFNAWLDGDPRG